MASYRKGDMLLPEPLMTQFTDVCIDVSWMYYEINQKYRKTSNVRHTKSQNLHDSCLVMQLSLPNSLKPGVKLRMKM